MPSLQSIWNQAFQNCTNLVTVDIPSTITFVDASAFNGCSKLATINVHYKSGTNHYAMPTLSGVPAGMVINYVEDTGA
jgi:hypothetical protein